MPPKALLSLKLIQPQKIMNNALFDKEARGHKIGVSAR